MNEETTVLPTIAAPRRRIRGLRITAVPTFANFMQLAGAAATLVGVDLKWGSAITLVVGGVVAVAVGMLREGGKI